MGYALPLDVVDATDAKGQTRLLGTWVDALCEVASPRKIVGRTNLRALLLEGERRLVLSEINSPEPNVGETLISVEIAGVGGSEYQGYNSPGIRPLPNIMGHGFAGLY